jgi:hypothetical protein
LSSNAIPRDKRHSFVALQGPQVGLLKTLLAIENLASLGTA